MKVKNLCKRLPRYLRIGPHRYEIGVSAGIHDLFGAELYGLTIPRASIIRISAAQSRSQARDTVLHEMLHAVAHLTAAFANLPEDPDEAEEAVIGRLSPMLLAALRDNPVATKFLLSADKE